MPPPSSGIGTEREREDDDEVDKREVSVVDIASDWAVVGSVFKLGDVLTKARVGEEFELLVEVVREFVVVRDRCGSGGEGAKESPVVPLSEF